MYLVLLIILCCAFYYKGWKDCIKNRTVDSPVINIIDSIINWVKDLYNKYKK